MEKTSVLRFLFVFIFICVISLAITFYSVDQRFGDRVRDGSPHGFATPVEVFTRVDGILHQNFQEPLEDQRRQKKKSLVPPPLIQLSDEMRVSIETQIYLSHSVTCFDRITDKYYVCDPRVENTRIACPIIHPGHMIQIVSDDWHIYPNITRPTTKCFILWFNKNTDQIQTKKIILENAIYGHESSFPALSSTKKNPTIRNNAPKSWENFDDSIGVREKK